MATSIEMPDVIEKAVDYLINEEGTYNSKGEVFRSAFRQQHSELIQRIKKGEIK